MDRAEFVRLESGLESLLAAGRLERRHDGLPRQRAFGAGGETSKLPTEAAVIRSCTRKTGRRQLEPATAIPRRDDPCGPQFPVEAFAFASDGRTKTGNGLSFDERAVRQCRQSNVACFESAADLPGSQRIARWAYQQAASVQALTWTRGRQLEPLSDRWFGLIGT